MSIPSQIKGAIFDMDGLLIDSEPFWEKADAAFFAKHGKVHSPVINRRIMGMGQREIIELFQNEYGIAGNPTDLILERKALLYEFLLSNLVLMEGAKEAVEAVKKKGLQMAIATSGHTREKTRQILDLIGFTSYFPIVMTGEDVHRSKPDPEIYLLTAERFHIAPSECLVFEDAPNGVQAGKAAGMVVYGVNKDPMIAEQLVAAKADKVVPSLKKL